MGTGNISIGKIPCPQLNLINSKRKTGVFKKFYEWREGSEKWVLRTKRINVQMMRRWRQQLLRKGYEVK